jgi:Domain of unknown function (DUF4278)
VLIPNLESKNMRLLFLIPLTIGLVAGYISQRATEDIAYLTGAVAAICLIVSLLVAPWQFQLALLVLVILSIRSSWQQLANKREGEETPDEGAGDFADSFSIADGEILAPSEAHRYADPAESATDKERKYRGVSYQPTAPICEVTEGAIAGKYRGTPWRVRTLKLFSLRKKTE